MDLQGHPRQTVLVAVLHCWTDFRFSGASQRYLDIAWYGLMCL